MAVRNCAPLLVVVSLAILANGASAQTCDAEIPGDAIPVLLERQITGLYDLPEQISQPTFWVRIKWHVVTSTTGERAIDDITLDRYTEELNSAFNGAGLRFCGDPAVHLIVDDALHVNVSSHYSLRMIEPTPNAIDIYWCTSLQNGALCGTSSYTISPIQGIVMQTTCMGASDVQGVLIHEVGHYFDLYHTHENGFGFECAEGSDCETTGDHVCDTNPSASLGFDECVNPVDCSLIESNAECTAAPGPPLCPEGQFYAPDTDNYMAYAPMPCLIQFTAGQHARARATFLTFRSELHHPDCNLTSDCVGDVNQDGAVNSIDLTIVLGNWLAVDSTADLDGDGVVNGADLTLVLANWDACK